MEANAFQKPMVTIVNAKKSTQAKIAKQNLLKIVFIINAKTMLDANRSGMNMFANVQVTSKASIVKRAKINAEMSYAEMVNTATAKPASVIVYFARKTPSVNLAKSFA
jgi:hypothetical protein